MISSFSPTALPSYNPFQKKQKLNMGFLSNTPRPTINTFNVLSDIYDSSSFVESFKRNYTINFDDTYMFQPLPIDIDNNYSLDNTEKEETITDAGLQFVNHYTIGDLSKYMLVQQSTSTKPNWCHYDMIDRLQKDLLVSGLINDPFSYSNIEKRLKTNLINRMTTITDQYDIRYIKDANLENTTDMNFVKDNSLSISGGGFNPYSKSAEYNKFVQWNTLYGEFLHDFTSSRITSVDQTMFFGDKNVEGMVNAGWENVLKKVFGTPDQSSNADYDYIRAKTLYNSQPLNETKYVQETIKTIQNNNPDLLYDLDYTPLTTFSTAYYRTDMQPNDTTIFNNELSQLYDTFTTSFSGSVIIPRKKIKGSEYCIVFYIFNPKPDYETPKTYKNVDLQMTDMNIDQNAVSARLLYSQIEDISTAPLIDKQTTPSPTTDLIVIPTGSPYDTPLNVKPPPPNYINKWFNTNKTLKMDNVELVNQVIAQNIPTLVTYSKGLDPITQSVSMNLTEIKLNGTGTNTIYTITQDENVITYFNGFVRKPNIQLNPKYKSIINNYVSNKRITVDTTEIYDDDVFAKLLLESAMGQATIESMNDLLSIWFDGFSTSQTQGATGNNDGISVADVTVNVKNNHLDTFVQLLDGTPATTEYNQIKFMKKPTKYDDDMVVSEPIPTTQTIEDRDGFMFQMGSTTVNNVAQALVEIREKYADTDTYKTPISSFKSNNTNNTDLINYAIEHSITNKALQSFIVYFIHHINDLHEQFNEIPFVSALLMFVAFAKSCGDELQRLTCEKMNDLLGETVFVLTRDRIFVAKCLAEYTPCISTIILDQLADNDELAQPTGGMKGGSRQGSVQTHGGILISPITAVLTETKTELTKLQEKQGKLSALKTELTKRIYAKLYQSQSVDSYDIFIIPASVTSMEDNDDDDNERIEKENAKRDINNLNQHIQKLTVLLDSLEMYIIGDDNSYTKIKAIIDVEINTLALRLLSSSEKQFIQQTGTTFPSNTKNMFNAIHILSGNEDITTKLLEIYTTATNCILNRIQTSAKQLQILTSAPENIEKIYTPIINNVIPTYEEIDKYIVDQHKVFLDKVVTGLEAEQQALAKRESRSRASSNASYVSGTDETIANTIDDIEAEIDNIDNELAELSKSTKTDSDQITELLATPNDPDAEEKLNEIGKKYNSFSQKVSSKISNLFKPVKKTSNGIQTNANKLLASINKATERKAVEFKKQREKLLQIVEKQKTRIKQPPPRQTTSTLRTIIQCAKTAYLNMNSVLNPVGAKRGFGMFGGKRTTKKKQTDTPRNNRRSNRRIRKIGVLTQKHKPRVFKQNPNRRKTKQNKQ